MAMNRVACYIRVSTEEQKLHGISLDAQRDKLKIYADKHNLKIVGWYEDEGVSGRKLIKNRPALQQMIKDAQAKKFDRIIFVKLDRFFRSVAEYHKCMELIDPVVWTATEEDYDLTTANGRLLVNMKVTISELEADQTAERINLVNEYKIKSGQPLTGSHRLGFGYKVGRDLETGLKNVIKDEEVSHIVDDIFQHYLTYQSKRATLVYINDKYDLTLGYTTISNMLKDTKYFGYFRGNPNYCEAYIDKAAYDRIQDILDSKNIKKQTSDRVYLFSGLLICPECGSRLKGNRNQNDYRTYRCANRHRNIHCSYRKCISEKLLEEDLLTRLNDLMSGYVFSATATDNSERIDYTSDRIKTLKSEMSRLNNMYRKSRISEAEYDREYEELEVKIKQLESQLEPAVERDLSKYHEIINSDWRAIYDALNRENQRAFLRKYIKEMRMDENGKLREVIFF